MTSEERLKIAEELLGDAMKRGDIIRLRDIDVNRWDGVYFTYRAGQYVPCTDERVLSRGTDVIEVIHQARQKLAAERNANKSPREKRLEEACARILRILEPSSPAGRLRDYLDDARKALKED